MKTTITKLNDLHQMAEQACAFILQKAQEAVQSQGYFTLVLSGGSALIPTFELLAMPEYAAKMPWNETYIFYQDDCYTNSSDMASNFNASWELMLKKVPIPRHQILVMPCDLSSVEAAAAAYEATLKAFFSEHGENGPFPAFDMVIGGVWPDGHTASLFPGDSAALNQTTRWIIPIQAPDSALIKDHITMTLPLINHARTVLMLVGAPTKATMMERVLNGDTTYPSSLIRAQKEIRWLIDRRIYCAWVSEV
jgi:6-phosphogluconolactonase